MSLIIFLIWLKWLWVKIIVFGWLLVLNWFLVIEIILFVYLGILVLIKIKLLVLGFLIKYILMIWIV